MTAPNDGFHDIEHDVTGPHQAELLSVAQLEHHARVLAGKHTLSKRTRGSPDILLPRLAHNARAFRRAYALISQDATDGSALTPAAEWFVDNYPLIEEQIRTAQRHLPPGYSRQLPRLTGADGAAGVPRVYALALELVSHSHGRVDEHALNAYVQAYQSQTPLRLGELWAIPIMLRLALLENLRRVVARITTGRHERQRAAFWMGKMAVTAADHGDDVVIVLSEMVKEATPFTDAFVSELAHRLHGQPAAAGIATAWLEQRVSARGRTLAHVFQAASQSQAADQVAMGSSIGGLRFLGAADWRSFVEANSVVEATLRGDPVGVYAAMDFQTRDRYRHAVEALARRSALDEVDVASRAVALASACEDKGVRSHVGYFLIDAGVAELEEELHPALTLRSIARRAVRRHGLALYIGMGASLSVLSAASLMSMVSATMSDRAVVLGCALGVLAGSQLSYALVQWVMTASVSPRVLPRLDFSGGIPSTHATLVAVPTLLTSALDIDSLVEALELRYLANRDAQLSFALLTDFQDAKEEHREDDAALLAHVRRGVEGLNARHQGAAFYLLHRPRRWNASEGPRPGVWMGWERKRGKLEDLNATLRGARDRFDVAVGDIDVLDVTQYVIALDSDTQLPRDAARALVGTMAHPLNRPVYDEALGRVRRGYSILQPRVGVSMASVSCTPFARLFAGESGIDPYTRAVSDTYQDLFGEGSFVGKGIYDVDALTRAVAGRFPENRVLSHDLLEGAYGRCGLVSDVLLVEEHPAAHQAELGRRARWLRGDWQIAAWLWPWVPGAALKGRVSNPLSALSWWKIFDNLRRSLIAPTLMVLLLVGWSHPHTALVATVFVLAVALVPGLLTSISSLARRPVELPWRRHVADVVATLWPHVIRDLLTISWLPIDALQAGLAIGRAWLRVTFTHRHLLEWRTASAAAVEGRRDLGASYRLLWFSPTTAAATATLLGLNNPSALVLAWPFMVAWAVSPALSWWLSRPMTSRGSTLHQDDVVFLRMVARRTWAFFADFAGNEDNHLPPDNVQEEPPRGVAHRTSPTNIGLGLTATLAAWDFGFITAGEVVARTARTLDTLDRMERYRGHFYNWYDTTTLEPLLPLYVSTVDSGNLAGHLLTLAAGLEALQTAPLLRRQVCDGLLDTLAVFEEEATTATATATASTAAALVAAIRARLREARDSPAADTVPETLALLRAVAADAAILRAPHPEAQRWLDALSRQSMASFDDLVELAPWALDDRGDPIAVDDVSDGQERPPDALTLNALAAWTAKDGDSDLPDAPSLRAARALSQQRAAHRVAELARLAARCRVMSEMDLTFLYDPARRLLSIGSHPTEHRLDASFYDLLASEARLTSYLGVASGQLPQEHWFSLGRSLTTASGRAPLLSWSGSMFEYLMPLLIMPTFDKTLLDETYRGIVQRQIDYGRSLDVPWGISESGYAKTDNQDNYQYRAFGIPGLGFARGLADDVVVAPYASVMALMVDPRAACLNLRRLTDEARMGRYGFYEAIDYTSARLPAGQKSVLVQSFMAHHQGMALLALDYALCDRPMQRRFLAEPSLRAIELLLQERVPRTVPILPRPAELGAQRHGALSSAGFRAFTSPSTPRPELQLLSNGTYHVVVSNAGGGSSRWRDLAVTRWREDPTRDNWGSFVYLRDMESGAFWSAAHQPALRRANEYEVTFSQGRASFRRLDGDIETVMDVSVSPEDDIELRRIRITNRSRVTRRLEVTSYAEVVLAKPADDDAHPAFSKLFVQTEVLREQKAILASRRPRSQRETSPTLLHLMCVHGTPPSATTSFESSREAFIGRGRTLDDPLALATDRLSDTAGSVLDPIVAIRDVVTIEAHQTVTLHLVTGVAATRDGALTLVEKYRDDHIAARVLELSWTQSQVALRRLDTTEADVQLYERLASHILYANPTMRAPPSILMKNERSQSGLWAHGISGDLPIALLRIGDIADISLVKDLITAHAYWRLKGLVVDVVVWNEDPSGYRQVLHEQILALASAASTPLDRPGGVFVRRGDQMSEEDKVLLQAVARFVVTDSGGTLAAQLDRQQRIEVQVPLLPARDRRTSAPTPAPPAPKAPTPATSGGDIAGLVAHNGLGGFTTDGREYVIRTHRDARTPSPWCNVLANPWFGSIVSESGSASTWCENARTNRLTPWSNDPVCDESGEVVLIRDEDSGDFWSPTPLPAPDDGAYTTRHGFGYSVFEHQGSSAVHSSLTTFVATDAPAKFLVLKLRNHSAKTKRLSVTVHFDLVLGATRPASIPHIVTDRDVVTGALFAVNRYSTEFAHRVAFLAGSETAQSFSGDRSEVLGRNGSWASPRCMRQASLSGRVGPALDPCFTMQVHVELAAGQEHELSFVFGSGADKADAQTLIARFRGVSAARQALQHVWSYWSRTLGAVHVQTPDDTVNFLANGWLLYQVLSARMWGRSGFYQSGGAFGFRDQLQDAMALVHAEPDLLREQLLRCASRQFPEGDVQHWWHPPSGRGVRTRISDDYLWLPYATARYVRTRGDTGVLDETVPYLEGRAVKSDEDSYYDLPGTGERSATLYEHCVRALEHGWRLGPHGLPLMGAGDWNDGMNLVGDEGRGESVWLAFFLHDVLTQFEPLARARGDGAVADTCLARAAALQGRIEEHGWDGAWYRRAYFDDGAPLGSASNAECQIDALPQAWAVLSGVGDPERVKSALASVAERLIDDELQVIKLFDPPFDGAGAEPGYVRGYVPGVRENGGQYTHAAVWTVMAFVAAGDIEKAWALFAAINPLRHGDTPAAMRRYKVEPYVVAADVYTNHQHAGRGGWTWYTGAAGWMYRLVVESFLGICLEVDHLRLAPKLPAAWPSVDLHYRHGETIHHIHVRNHGEAAVTRVVADGVDCDDRRIPLHSDRREHWVVVDLGPPP